MAQIFLDVVLQLQNEFLLVPGLCCYLWVNGENLEKHPYREATKGRHGLRANEVPE